MAAESMHKLHIFLEERANFAICWVSWEKTSFFFFCNDLSSEQAKQAFKKLLSSDEV